MRVPYFKNYASGLLGEMLEKVEHVQKDLILHAASLGGSISTAVSGVAKVRSLSHSPAPIATLAAGSAGSGAGKSQHLEFGTTPIEEKVALLQRDFSKQQLRQEVKILIWNKIRGSTERMVARDYDGSRSSISAHEEHLLSLYAEKPTGPLRPNIIYRDTTIQAILHGANGFPIVGLLDDEGGRLLNILRPRDFHTLASIWDGRLIAHNRVQGGRMEIQMVLTLLLLTQPEVFLDFLAKRGKLFKASGLAARLLPYWVDKNWASEKVIHAELDRGGELHAQFVARLHDLLDEAVRNAKAGLDTLPVKELSPGAKTALQGLNRQYQEMMGDPRYANCVDFLAKMVDHVTRMAAKWHVFEGREGDISAEYVEAAAQAMQYHLEVFHFLHGQPAREHLETVDKERLLDVIRDACTAGPPTRGELVNLAFNAGIATSARFMNALGLLGKERKIEITRRGNVRLTPLITL